MTLCYTILHRSGARRNVSLTLWSVSAFVFRAAGKHMTTLMMPLASIHQWNHTKHLYGLDVLGPQHFLCFITWRVLWSTWRRWFEIAVTSMTTSELEILRRGGTLHLCQKAAACCDGTWHGAWREEENCSTLFCGETLKLLTSSFVWTLHTIDQNENSHAADQVFSLKHQWMSGIAS